MVKEKISMWYNILFYPTIALMVLFTFIWIGFAYFLLGLAIIESIGYLAYMKIKFGGVPYGNNDWKAESSVG